MTIIDYYFPKKKNQFLYEMYVLWIFNFVLVIMLMSLVFPCFGKGKESFTECSNCCPQQDWEQRYRDRLKLENNMKESNYALMQENEECARKMEEIRELVKKQDMEYQTQLQLLISKYNQFFNSLNESLQAGTAIQQQQQQQQ